MPTDDLNKIQELKKFVDYYNATKTDNFADLEITRNGKLRAFKLKKVSSCIKKRLPRKLRNGWT